MEGEQAGGGTLPEFGRRWKDAGTAPTSARNSTRGAGTRSR